MLFKPVVLPLVNGEVKLKRDELPLKNELIKLVTGDASILVGFNVFKKEFIKLLIGEFIFVGLNEDNSPFSADSPEGKVKRLAKGDPLALVELNIDDVMLRIELIISFNDPVALDELNIDELLANEFIKLESSDVLKLLGENSDEPLHMNEFIKLTIDGIFELRGLTSDGLLLMNEFNKPVRGKDPVFNGRNFVVLLPNREFSKAVIDDEFVFIDINGLVKFIGRLLMFSVGGVKFHVSFHLGNVPTLPKLNGLEKLFKGVRFTGPPVMVDVNGRAAMLGVLFCASTLV